MADLQVTSVRKGPARLGVLAGPGWRWTARQVTTSIAHGFHSFYLLVDGLRHEVGIFEDSRGTHLRSFRDGRWNDALVRLPDCPRVADRRTMNDEDLLREAFSRIRQDVAMSVDGAIDEPLAERLRRPREER
jgi:hypothetical protein